MGTMAVRMADGAALQGCRKSILGFFKAFMRHCRDRKLLTESFLPRLVTSPSAAEVCLLDSFGSEPPAARLAEVLDLFHAVTLALKGDGAAGMAAVLPRLLRPAVELISTNYSDNPEMRHSTYRLAQALCKHCPGALLAIAPPEQKLFLDTLLWGIKHEDPFVAERACVALRDFLRAEASAGATHASNFFSAFLLGVLQDVLFVLTDRMHKAQFTIHVELLRGLFAVVHDTTLLPSPLWDQSTAPQPAGTTNASFIFNHLCNLLARAFPNVATDQVAAFVRGLGTPGTSVAAYRTGVRDFLIESLRFGVSKSQELWRAEQAAKAAAEQSRRAAVPGLARPATQPVMGMQPTQHQAAQTAKAGGTTATLAALEALEDDEEF